MVVVLSAAMLAPAEWSDGDLARAVSAGTADSGNAAEGELYRRFAPRVRLYGLRHLRDEDAARDLVQQVLLLAIGKLRGGSVREADQIASFIFGVSRMIVTDFKRQERRRRSLRETVLVPAAFEAPVSDDRLDLDRLETCVARLKERERMVVLLTFYAEKTASDVAGELGISEGNVRVIRHRALRHLRACVLSGEQV
jgi:RNA polymerase sigma-70 factor (ECF subfamily)